MDTYTKTYKSIIIAHGTGRCEFPAYSKGIDIDLVEAEGLSTPLKVLVILGVKILRHKIRGKGVTNALLADTEHLLSVSEGLSDAGREYFKDDEAILAASSDYNAAIEAEGKRSASLGADEKAGDVEAPQKEGKAESLEAPKQSVGAADRTLAISDPAPVLAQSIPYDDDFGRLARRKVAISEITIPGIFDQTHRDILDESIVASIKEVGLLNPIAVTPPPMVLISGRTRLRVHEYLGLTHIDTIFIDVPRDRLEEYILDFDVRRDVSNEEDIRRFAGYLAIEKVKAAPRQQAGTALVGNSPEGGSARDLAGKRVGADGRHMELALNLLLEIDRRLADPALADAARMVRKSLEKSILGGLKKAHSYGWPTTGWKPKCRVPRPDGNRVSKREDVSEQGTENAHVVDSGDPALECSWCNSDAIKGAEGADRWITTNGIRAACKLLKHTPEESVALENLLLSIAPALERLKRLIPDANLPLLLERAGELVGVLLEPAESLDEFVPELQDDSEEEA